MRRSAPTKFSLRLARAVWARSKRPSIPASAALNHPNIYHVYDVGPNYLVIEFIVGTAALSMAGFGYRIGSHGNPASDDVSLADWGPDYVQIAVVRGANAGQVVEYPVGTPNYRTQGAIGSLRVSSRGDSIALADKTLTGDLAANLVIIDPRGHQKTPPHRWNVLSGLAWSPDGNAVWIVATVSGVRGVLYAIGLNGQQRFLQDFTSWVAPTSVSPDGRLLLFTSEFSSRMRFGANGRPEEIDFSWQEFSTAAAISVDRSQILFSLAGDAAANDYDAYIREVNGRPAVKLGVGLAMAISPDIQWAMANPAEVQPSQLVAYPTHTGSPRPPRGRRRVASASRNWNRSASPRTARPTLIRPDT